MNYINDELPYQILISLYDIKGKPILVKTNIGESNDVLFTGLENIVFQSEGSRYSISQRGNQLYFSLPSHKFFSGTYLKLFPSASNVNLYYPDKTLTQLVFPNTQKQIDLWPELRQNEAQLEFNSKTGEKIKVKIKLEKKYN